MDLNESLKLLTAIAVFCGIITFLLYKTNSKAIAKTIEKEKALKQEIDKFEKEIIDSLNTKEDCVNAWRKIMIYFLDIKDFEEYKRGIENKTSFMYRGNMKEHAHTFFYLKGAISATFRYIENQNLEK